MSVQYSAVNLPFLVQPSRSLKCKFAQFNLSLADVPALLPNALLLIKHALRYVKQCDNQHPLCICGPTWLG